MLLALIFWPFVIFWTLIGGGVGLPNLIGSSLISTVQSLFSLI
jgi:hypothetical protein